MRQAVLLGVRLAWLDRGPARMRSGLVALAAAVGSGVLLGAIGLVAADMGANPVRYAERGLIWLAVALVLGVAVPVLVLAATVGRLSAALRGQRLAALRLLGMGPGQGRMVAVVETGVAACLGSVLGVGLTWALRPALARVPVFGATYPAEAVRAPAIVVLLVVVLVPLVVVAVSALPERLGAGRALGGVRRAEARRPSWLRVVPLVGGIAWCAAFTWVLRRSDAPRPPLVLTVNLVGSVTALGLGVLLVVPVLVRLVGDLLLLLARSPATRLAARRIQAQPTTMTRVVSGLLIGLFVVTGARCVVVAFESTPQYEAAERNLISEQQVETVVPTRRLDAALAELRDLPGVRATVPYAIVNTEDGDTCPTEVSCLQALVMSCAELARVAELPLPACRDDQASWLRPVEVGTPRAVPDELTWVARDYASGSVVTTASLPSPTDNLGGVLGDASSVYADVLLPPDLPGVAALASPRAATSVLVLADPGDDLADRLDATGLGAAGYYDTGDYDFVATLRALVWSVGALVVSLGLLSFGIAAVDRAVERRREVASLQVVGVPAAVLRRAQWIEVAAPLVIGSLLAVAAGLSAGATYLSLDAEARLPWSATLLLAGLGVVGGAALAGVTVLAASPRLRPELIRAE